MLTAVTGICRRVAVAAASRRAGDQLVVDCVKHAIISQCSAEEGNRPAALKK